MNRPLIKKVFISILLIFVASPIFSALAQEKVATVSLQRALNEVDEGKKAKDALKVDFDTKQKQIESMKMELKKLKDDYDKQSMIWSDEVRKQKGNEIQSKLAAVQQKAMEYENELNAKQSQSADKILAALKTMVVDLAKKNGYDVLYENSADFILYSAKGVDITNQLIQQYNAKGGSAAAAPAKK